MLLDDSFVNSNKMVKIQRSTFGCKFFIERLVKNSEINLSDKTLCVWVIAILKILFSSEYLFLLLMLIVFYEKKGIYDDY